MGGRYSRYRSYRKGFTLVELLIVIVVIAILAAITIVAYNGIQVRARDSARKQDLQALAKAIHLYNVDVGNYAEAGCGSGAGSGWLGADYDGSGPNVSVNDCLLGKGAASSVNYLGAARKDPSGLASCAGVSCTAYMKASCGASGTWLMAHLESLPTATNETDGTCYPTWDTAYGINYLLKVD